MGVKIRTERVRLGPARGSARRLPTVAEPWGTLLAIGALYIGSIPLSIHSYRRLRRTAEELRVSAAHPDGDAAAENEAAH